MLGRTFRFASAAALAGASAAAASAYSKTTEEQRRQRGLFSALTTVCAEDLGTFLAKARYDGPLPDAIANLRFDELMPQPIRCALSHWQSCLPTVLSDSRVYLLPSLDRPGRSTN
jgi:hypothetical protein